MGFLSFLFLVILVFLLHFGRLGLLLDLGTIQLQFVNLIRSNLDVELIYHEELLTLVTRGSCRFGGMGGGRT